MHWQLVTASVLIGQQHLAAAIPGLADEGAGALEVWMNSPSHFDGTSAMDVEELRSAMEGRGLRAYSAHAPFGEQLDLSALEESARLAAVSATQAALHAARALGAEVLVVHPGVGEPAPDERPLRVRAAGESVKALAELAGQCGVRIAVENMVPAGVGGRAEEVASIVDGVGTPYVGACLDTGHAHLGEGVAAAVSALGHRIIAVHLDDNDGSSDQHRLPSKGTIDWEAAAAALREVHYAAPICVEAGRWDDLTVREMYDIVRRTLGS